MNTDFIIFYGLDSRRWMPGLLMRSGNGGITFYRQENDPDPDYSHMMLCILAEELETSRTPHTRQYVKEWDVQRLWSITFMVAECAKIDEIVPYTDLFGVHFCDDCGYPMTELEMPSHRKSFCCTRCFLMR